MFSGSHVHFTPPIPKVLSITVIPLALPYPLNSSPPIHGQSAMKRLRTRFLVGTMEEICMKLRKRFLAIWKSRKHKWAQLRAQFNDLLPKRKSPPCLTDGLYWISCWLGEEDSNPRSWIQRAKQPNSESTMILSNYLELRYIFLIFLLENVRLF